MMASYSKKKCVLRIFVIKLNLYERAISVEEFAKSILPAIVNNTIKQFISKTKELVQIAVEF